MTGETHYHAPQSLADTLALLSAHRDYQILAGGTDLLIRLRAQNADKSAHIIDIKNLPGAREVSLNAEGLFIGAAASAQSITERADIKALFPGLTEAIDLIGSTQIQGRCSVGGNLCNASPAADTVPALFVNRAVCHINGPRGERKLAVENFTTGPGENALAEGELLTGLFIPAPIGRSADAYLRFIPRTEMDIAVVGAAVALSLDDEGVCSAARVAIGAVAPTALLVTEAAQALLGTRLEDDALAAAGEAAIAAASPISDKRGSAEFRRQLVGVLTRRAASIARDRARERVDDNREHN